MNGSNSNSCTIIVVFITLFIVALMMSVIVQKYLANYPSTIVQQVEILVKNKTLAARLRNKYPKTHSVTNDRDLREYVLNLKRDSMKSSDSLSKVIFDPRIHVVNNALGLHSFVSRIQGTKIKRKNEIRISSFFKKCPEAFLKMICVHELAHLREKEHNKSFYRLCTHMLSDYHQVEFDVRLLLIEQELHGPLY